MRRYAAVVGALLTTSAAVLVLSPRLASAAAAQTSQATSALRYLYSQVGSQGDIAGSAGATEDVVISDADNGYDPATLRNQVSGTTALSYLAGQASTIKTAGAAAKYILAWVAAGKPAQLNANAMLDRLNTSTASGGFLSSSGTFHASSASVETANAFSQSLAVLADRAAGRALPTNATAWLRCAQRSDGGFGYVIDDSAAKPPKACGDTTSDTNDTGIALQALGSAGVVSVDAAAETYLHSAQQADGGFGFAVGAPSDPGSDTIVLQALVAIGQDPAAWAKGGSNPLANLETFADPASGGYVFPGNTTPDAFTTSSVPQALALKPYAAKAPFTTGLAPATPAATASPSPGASAAARGVAGITVPDTGANGASHGGLPVALLLLAGGALVGSALALRRRRAPMP